MCYSSALPKGTDLAARGPGVRLNGRTRFVRCSVPMVRWNGVEPPMDTSATVVWINSGNFSGSTLAGLMLGSHSRSAFLGELHHRYKPRSSRKAGLQCDRCQEQPCPVLDDLPADPHRLYAELFERTGRAILVDTSKKTTWTEQFLDCGDFRRCSVLLVRDPRGYCFSRMKRRSDRPLEAWIRDWADTNRGIFEFLLLHRAVMDFRVVTYYSLTAHVDATLEALCRWLGIPPESSMAAYWKTEHHALAGNGAVSFYSDRYSTPDPEFYRAHHRQQFVDLRWQTALNRRTQQQIIRHPEVVALLEQLGLGATENGLLPLAAPAAGAEHLLAPVTVDAQARAG